MAKGKSRGGTLPPDDFDEGELEDQPLPPPVAEPTRTGDIEALKLACANLVGQQGATLTVNKVIDGIEKRCWTFVPQEFDENLIVAKWGPGLYYVYARAAGKFFDKFKLDYAPSADSPQPQAGHVNGRLFAPQVSPADHLGGIRELILSNQQAQREQFNDFKTLLLEVMRPRQEQTNNPMQAIEMMERIKALGGGRGNDGGSSAVETLLKGVRLARDLGIDPGAALDDGPPGWIKSALRVAENFLGDRPAPRSAASPEAAMPPGPPAAGENMQQIIAALVVKQLPMLLRGAAAGTDPGVYAQLLLDQVPTAMHGYVYQQLRAPEWFDVLSKLDAHVVPHRVWVTQLRDAFVLAMEEAASEAGATPPAADPPSPG